MNQVEQELYARSFTKCGQPQRVGGKSCGNGFKLSLLIRLDNFQVGFEIMFCAKKYNNVESLSLSVQSSREKK